MINDLLPPKGILSWVCASTHRLDPFDCDRLKSVIKSYSYYVLSPNYVWHIDGNHKLIRWQIVIHGGIDDCSRVVVVLKLSTDNCTHTMLSCFENGVFEYGLPTCIRSDLGGENVEVWRHLEEIGVLDPLHEVNIFCLHTCYLPRIA
uniref:Integrase catalytic domain-containing protein n=1 Tax=Amphimedon queenslandica TaxID=400682 RepID=A0A1X7UUV1_AMPQE